MLPLLYTRRFLLESWTAKRANASPSMIYSADNLLYAVRRVDTASMPEERSTMVFECDLHPGMQQQNVFLGLMETEALNLSSRSPGIGISIDLQTGLVTDLVNDQGVIGYLDDAPIEANGPLHVRIEVDMIGRVLLPRILVGNDIVLHPALYLDARDGLSALVGTSVHPPCDARFENTVLRTCASENEEILTAH